MKILITESIAEESVQYLRDRGYEVEEYLGHSQEEIERNEDFSIFRYNIIPSFEFTQELLKQGANLEVLSPQWYRDEFAGKIAQMHQLYT